MPVMRTSQISTWSDLVFKPSFITQCVYHCSWSKAKKKLNGLRISPVFKISSLRIYVLSTSRCIPMFPNSFTIRFFSPTVSFLTPLSSCSWACLSWSASPGLTYFSSVTKKIVFSFLLEESDSSTAGILAKVNLSPCLVCYFSCSPGCCVGVRPPPPEPAHLSPP